MANIPAAKWSGRYTVADFGILPVFDQNYHRHNWLSFKGKMTPEVLKWVQNKGV